jgi:hypothetical protein
MARTVAAVARDGALLLDLNADEASLVAAGARQGCRSVVHAADQLAEWEISVALRPPSVRSFELAVAQLLEGIGTDLDTGWRGSCTACGQPLRIAAWRWEETSADTDPNRRPTARRAVCAACKGLGKRGDASAIRPGEAATQVALSGELRSELLTLLGPDALARWTPRQLQVFVALQRGLARSTEVATSLTALRVAVTQAALRSARPDPTLNPGASARPWWEIAPWQALAEAVDDQRRQLLLAEELPRDLTLSSDLVNLGYPGRPVIASRASAAARSALISLGTTSGMRAVLVRLRLGDSAPSRIFRQRATLFAGGVDLVTDAATSADPESPAAVAAAIARLLVALDPLIQDGSLFVVEVPESLPSLAGCLTAASMASGRVSEIERFTREDGVSCFSITITTPPTRSRSAGAPRSGERGPLRGDALQRVLADLVVARGEPCTAVQLLTLYALHRSSGGGLLESPDLLEEFNEILTLRYQLRPLGSADRLVQCADNRIFIDGRTERERLGAAGGDADDAAIAAAATAGRTAGSVPESDRLLTAALREAYFVESEEGSTPRWSATNHAADRATDRGAERAAQVALLLTVGAAMGLHTAIAPALAEIVVDGLPLGRRVARDPIDSSPPLRLRSDRAAFDQIDALLFRRGRSVIMCEVALGPLPLATLLLARHSKVPNDREVVRLLVTERALLPLVKLRLARDERLAAAWEEQNWHVLASDQLARMAELTSPRLADLEQYLGAGPLEPIPGAQLDLGSFGWEAS